MLSMLTLTTLVATGCQAGGLEGGTAAYAKVLDEHVKRGRVDYKAIAEDPANLDAFLRAVAEGPAPKKRNARLGFYADAYNAIVIKSVIENGRPRSVLDVKDFFKAKKHTVAGKTLSLDQLEKKVINPYANDPRTHFVLVCAAVGCPILEGRPYSGTNMEKRFNKASRAYLASKAGAQVKEGSIKISKIFDWYANDFGGKHDVLTFVRNHLSRELSAKVGSSPKVEFLDYSWTLNQQ